MALLRIEGAHKGFDGNVVLRDLSLTVGLHDVVALIGASGSGKSTLLRCIDGLVPVDAGDIWIGEGDDRLEVTAADADLDAIRRRVGIVFQQYNLFPHMSVLANITLAPRKVLKHSAKDADAQARELLTRFGLAEKADDYPDRLSGGQQQRVAIVRALAMQPQLMLFDEVTSALDPQLVGEVLDVIRELKETGMTIVMATHEMGFAREVADRVAFLHAGGVLEEAPPQRLFGSPRHQQTREFLLRVHAPGVGG